MQPINITFISFLLNYLLQSDDQRSEGSSILSSKFFLRDSTIHGKKKVMYSLFPIKVFNCLCMYTRDLLPVFLIKAKSKCCNTNEKGNTDCIHEGAPIKSQPPLIAKWRNGVKLQLPGRFDGDGKNDIYNIYFFT